MDYSQYTDHPAGVKEYRVDVSDGVSLKIIDFTSQNVARERSVILFVAGWISLISGWKDVLKVLTAEHRVIYLESREKKSSYRRKNLFLPEVRWALPLLLNIAD